MATLDELQTQLTPIDSRINELNKQINFWSRWDREPEIRSAITQYQNELQNLVPQRNNIAGQMQQVQAQNQLVNTPYQNTLVGVNPQDLGEAINSLRNNVKFAKERNTQSIINNMKSTGLQKGTGEIADVYNTTNPNAKYDVGNIVINTNPYTGIVSGYTGTNQLGGFTVSNPTGNLLNIANNVPTQVNTQPIQTNTVPTQSNISNENNTQNIQNKINQLNATPEQYRPSDWQSQLQTLQNQLNTTKQKWF